MAQQIVDTARKLGDISAEEQQIALAYLERFPGSKPHHAIAFAMLKARQ